MTVATSRQPRPVSRPAGDDVLVVSRLAKAYRRRRVLGDVSFRVPRGRVVGIDGENGAGKTTLLRCVVGDLRADAGLISRPRRLGYCPQDAALPDVLTPREVLRLFAAGYAMDERGTARAVGTLAERLGCARHLDDRVGRLSGGTRQKVNLMAALLPDPELLVLDEPYQGFDHETYVAFWDYATEFAAAGGAVLVVSHVHSEPHRLDTLLSLRDGRVSPAVRVAAPEPRVAP